jgi:sortase A
LAVNQVGWVNIPAIGVGAPIVEGKDDNAMTYGVWHRPGTGTPLTNSNTVLAGHRYQYLNGPRTFYSLDKVKAGDLVEVKWGDQKFTYRIVRSFVVSKDKMFIEAPTTVPLLTVYTCTPLWTSTNRLVIQATPI